MIWVQVSGDGSALPLDGQAPCFHRESWRHNCSVSLRLFRGCTAHNTSFLEIAATRLPDLTASLGGFIIFGNSISLMVVNGLRKEREEGQNL